MAKSKINSACFEIKIDKSKGLLPRIQNFDYSDISSIGGLSAGYGAEGKVLKKSSTLADCFERKHGKSELIDPDLWFKLNDDYFYFVKLFHRISLRLERVLAQSQFKYGIINEYEVKSLSPRSDIHFKSGSIKNAGARKKFKSPETNKNNLNKHAIRSRIFENTIKWIK